MNVTKSNCVHKVENTRLFFRATQHSPVQSASVLIVGSVRELFHFRVRVSINWNSFTGLPQSFVRTYSSQNQWDRSTKHALLIRRLSFIASHKYLFTLIEPKLHYTIQEQKLDISIPFNLHFLTLVVFSICMSGDK